MKKIITIKLIQNKNAVWFSILISQFFYFRDILAFIYIPVVQKELDIFRKTVWNSHRGRKQKNKQLQIGMHFLSHLVDQSMDIPWMKATY